jgi:phage-related protein
MKQKNLSPFAEVALQLDAEFAEILRLSDQLEQLDVESEFGLEQAKKILLRFSENGARAGESMHALAKHLNDLRERSEVAAKTMAERAQIVEKFHAKQQNLLSQFQLLGNAVRAVTQGIGELRKSDAKQLSDSEKAQVKEQLPELTSKLALLIDQSKNLKVDAQAAKLKSLEKNAHALSQTLANAQNKLGTFLR